ncbi:GSCOCG00006264001-RA-CDS [Cotesia congregata]|nr:GSCOCG00006264001-RA-CDS [Cotesia congregata]
MSSTPSPSTSTLLKGASDVSFGNVLTQMMLEDNDVQGRTSSVELSPVFSLGGNKFFIIVNGFFLGAISGLLTPSSCDLNPPPVFPSLINTSSSISVSSSSSKLSFTDKRGDA